VKLLKLLETSRCISVSSIAYGIIGNAVKVPVSFRNVLDKILQQCRVVPNQIKPPSCVPDCYDMEVSGNLG